MAEQLPSSGSLSPRSKSSRRFFRVFLGRPVVVLSFLIILVFLVCAAVPAWLTSFDPNKQDLNSVLLMPGGDHWLGTDNLGRDLMSRIIFGARTALMVGILALGIAAAIGMIIGMIAGFFGGAVNTIIMRLIDALMVFPPILLALTIAGLLGGGVKMVVIALGIGFVPGYARVMCGQALAIRGLDYILALKSMGANNFRILYRHVLPNAFPPMIVLMTMMIGMTILAEAGLSFLGIGITEPTVAWGTMVNDGYKYLLTHPILSIAPGTAIIIIVYAFNIVGDGLRDAIDPRFRGTL